MCERIQQEVKLMAFKIHLSERSIQFLNNCLQGSEAMFFDAINAPTLLTQLMSEESTYLAEYIDTESMLEEDDVYDFIELYCTQRQKKLKDEVEKANKDKKKQADENENAQNKTTQKIEAQFKLKTEHDANVTFEDEKGEKFKYPVADEVLEIFSEMTRICKENNIEFVEPIHIASAMFSVENKTLKRFFKDVDVNFRLAKEYYTGKKIFSVGIIPYELSGFMSCLHNKVNIEKPCEILMRDKEVEQIWNISLKKNKRNTIIVGEAGVGKSALIEKITYEIMTGTCPERFKDFFVMSLDVNSLIAGTTFRGQAEERIKKLIEYLEQRDNIILFIDEVHTILGAGSCFEGEMDLANALKPILARGDTIVIGATTEAEYEAYFAKDAALSRRFEKVVVEEPKVKDVYPMIKNKVQVLSEFHGVKISKPMVEYTIMIANCFAFEKKNPDKTLDLIDRSMVAAYRKGKKSVNKENILANFGIFFDLYDGMGENARKEVAYHEAGHYIVGKTSGRLVNINWLAISIMPAEDYLGVTCYEYRKDKVPFRNREYYIDLLAFDLGGRVAEKVFREDFTSGAGQDLDDATRQAFDVITKYGMSIKKEEDRNNIFLNTPDYPMFTEKSANKINEEVQKLINIAYKRAEEIIEEHKELLEMIVKALLEKKIMSETELDVVWQKYLKEKEKKA